MLPHEHKKNATAERRNFKESLTANSFDISGATLEREKKNEETRNGDRKVQRPHIGL